MVLAHESSAGGVVLREDNGVWLLAIIRPRGRQLWALPKGHIDGNETAQQSAEREVREETGLTVSLVQPLGDVRYIYQFRGQRVSKRVQFFLFRYLSGQIDQLDPSMRHEVDEARWIPLSEAAKTLAYPGEREMAKKAEAWLTAHQVA